MTISRFDPHDGTPLGEVRTSGRDEVVAAIARAREACVGWAATDPAARDTAMRDVVHAQVEDALTHGARAETGGEIPDGPGAHDPATVLTGVDDSMTVMREETFGPVARAARRSGSPPPWSCHVGTHGGTPHAPAAATPGGRTCRAPGGA